MLASIFSLNVLQTALELGCIYALVALALFLSYSILNIADPVSYTHLDVYKRQVQTITAMWPA